MAVMSPSGANPYLLGASLLFTAVQSYASYSQAKYELMNENEKTKFEYDENDLSEIQFTNIEYFQLESQLSNREKIT